MHFLSKLSIYLRTRWLLAVVFAYFATGLLLRLHTSANILPPCLWTALFHVHCPGCGMTRACLCLLKMDFSGAWHANPLALPAIGVILCAIIVDFRKFTLHLRHPSKKEHDSLHS